MNTYQTGHPIAMEATSVVTLEGLAIIRKPLGCPTFAGGPFKPISQGFAFFFEALLFTIAPGNADIIDTLAHVDVLTQPASDHPTSAQSTENSTPVDVETKIGGLTEEIISAGVIHIDVSAQLSQDTPGIDITEPFIEEFSALESLTSAEEPASSGEETIAGTEETPALAEHAAVADTNLDAGCDTPETAASDNLATVNDAAASQFDEGEGAETSTMTANACTDEDGSSAIKDMIAAQEVDLNTAATTESAAECAPDSNDIPAHELGIEGFVENVTAVEELEQLASPEEDTMSATGKDTATEDNAGALAAATIESIVVETTQGLNDAPISEAIAQSPAEIVLPTEGNKVATDVAGLENSAETKAEVQDTSEKDNDNQPASVLMPAYAFPLLFEDDFDGAISSIPDTSFERFMEIDTTWCTPHIVEKGKSERDVVRERLANRSTAMFNRQNLILEKAARALSIEGTSPVQVAIKTTKPASEPSDPATPATSSAPMTPPSPMEPGNPMTHETEAPYQAEDKSEQSQETLSDNEEAVAALAKNIVTSRSHSRSASSSSNGSKDSAEAVFDSAPCPGTPVTQYSTTPIKGEPSEAVAGGESISNQQAVDECSGDDAPEDKDEITE
jgi:hypothetical protein